jgi:hypothetical protein
MRARHFKPARVLIMGSLYSVSALFAIKKAVGALTLRPPISPRLCEFSGRIKPYLKRLPAGPYGYTCRFVPVESKPRADQCQLQF